VLYLEAQQQAFRHAQTNKSQQGTTSEDTNENLEPGYQQTYYVFSKKVIPGNGYEIFRHIASEQRNHPYFPTNRLTATK